MGIRPYDVSVRDKQEYKTLVEIAQSYFDRGLDEEFSNNFMEGQYLIPLWTAHLILEYGKPTNQLIEKTPRNYIRLCQPPVVTGYCKGRKGMARQFQKIVLGTAANIALLICRGDE